MHGPSAKQSAGFTLIETVLVAAISGLMLVIVFAGQRDLRNRARFDAAIDSLIQNISYARNYTSANVNTEGLGTDTLDEFVGAGIEFDNGHPNHQLAEIEPIYVELDSSGNQILTNVGGGVMLPNYWNVPKHGSCPRFADGECFEEFLSSGDNLTLTTANIAELNFIHNNGKLSVCIDVAASFSDIATTCHNTPSTPVKLDFKDDTGLTAEIQIDPVTGIAKRLF